MKVELLEYSYDHKLSHIPSALSMLDYVDVLFTNGFVTPNDKIVIGKPFGAQAYYLVWRKLGYLVDIEKLGVGIKHDEIDFVDYSEETMGNALGVATGIAIANPDKRVWVNISDAALQMGNTLEALQFIGHNNIKNVFVTVDYNGAQVTGYTSDILSVHPVKDMCRHYHWWVQEVDGHDKAKLKLAFGNLIDTSANIVFCNTRKGNGVNEMIKDIKKWHYKKIETWTELQSLVAAPLDT